MIITILHISDLHFSSNNAYTDKNVDAIVSALQKHMVSASGIIIICSGDLTNAGYYQQACEVGSFFEQLNKEISNRYDIEDIYSVIVPGNHDNNYKVSCYTAEDLTRIKNNNEYASYLCKELDKEKNALNVCRSYGCFDETEDICVRDVELDGVKIRFWLVNTAPFSALCEDQGFHFLDKERLNQSFERGDADFSFTVMHHTYHYFTWEIRNNLEEKLIEKADIVFVGHEHYSKIRTLGDVQTDVNILAGGKLCEKGNWGNSEFFIGNLDTNNRNYSIVKYIWDESNRMYIGGENFTISISKTIAAPDGIPMKASFIKGLFADTKFGIAPSVLDYFVFPLLEEEPLRDGADGREFKEAEAFFEYITNLDRLFITGASGAGKSTFAVYLFEYYSKRYVTMFISGDDVQRRNYDQIIKSLFEEEHSYLYPDFEKFNQLSPSRKVVIIDDVHLISEDIFDEFLKYLDERYGKIIFLSQFEIQLDIMERLKKITIMSKFRFFRMGAFYSDKRRALVENIAGILIKQPEARDRTVEGICEVLTTHKGLYAWIPGFITQYAKYACDNIGVSLVNDGETFSIVFEHNLTSLMKPYVGNIKTDKIFMVLGKIAYEVHTKPMNQKKYPIKLVDICEVVDKYKEEYDSLLDTEDFLDVVTRANILKKQQDGYIFSDRNYLAYFVAIEMKRRILKDGKLDEFYHCLNYACFGINADVVLFLTYIYDNENIINWLISKAEEYMGEWEEFSLNPCNINYLTEIPPITVNAVTDKERLEKKEIIVEEEKKEDKYRSRIDQTAIYMYDEDAVELIDEMVRDVSLVVILSRALPSFEHMIESKSKKKCVELIYSLPLKIFYMWAAQIEKESSEMVSELKKLLEEKRLDNVKEYRNKNMPFSDMDALELLRRESLLLLMELMNGTISSATKGDAIRHLDKFLDSKDNGDKNQKKMTYKIEHLMSVGKRDDPGAFFEEVLKFFDEAKTPIEKNLLRQVARHYMLSSSRISQKQMQTLNSKLFKESIPQKQLIVARKKNENNR